ncbi:unnamed protein product [Trichobilharzia regenti]|nr:unnamed protein product [Trichobilharzia regenti]
MFIFVDTDEEIIERDILFIVKTGDRKYAGTDSGVYLTMFGINGESTEYHLSSSKTHTNKFEQNHEDVFSVSHFSSVMCMLISLVVLQMKGFNIFKILY